MRMSRIMSGVERLVSESMWVTAQTIKKSVVEERSIDRIMDKTILGDFKKEQEKFVKEQNSKRTESTEAPWVGYLEEEIIKQQILALSKDKRNLLRNPPAGVHFHFNFERLAPVAMAMLQEDPALNKLRYELVPKCIKEDMFWRNYFYRVSLIKQSAQLASLALQQAEGSISSGMTLGATKTSDSGMEEVSFSPTRGEFASHAYNLPTLSTEDTSEGMVRLGVSRPGCSVLLEDAADEDIPEWEKELQRELQDFEALEGQEKVSEAWEKEIEDMLQEED
uniref:Synapse-associated protein 1-like isoform X2 n=1 Tax=Geotrypetes seraphini TaxID=260995 RepID=A0A6P8S445_GEOSA|nr:synapse-associated protein 1-like isoform X2 [Geotrypetes seraphini]